MKKTISVLLALVLLLGAFPFALPAAAADDPQTYSGTWGENITWKLEDGVLTVSGDGAIGEDFFSNEISPLVKKVIINEGITEIGRFAFRYMSIESIVFPDSLESIGQLAFWDCWYLKDITFGANLKYISNDAFPCCRGLETVILPDSVIQLGEQAFYGCNRLKKIQIPAGVTSIGVNTFYECSQLEQLIILNGNAEMDDDCLVELHGATPTIYSYAGGSVEAFANEKGFNFVELSNNDTVIETVDGKLRAFGTCGSNIEWTLEDGVLTVSGHGALKPVHMHYGTEWYSSWNEATEKFQTVTVDTENDGFPWTSILRQIDSTYLGNERWDRADVVKRLYDGTLDVNRYWDAITNVVKKIVIEEGITSIADGAFYEFIPEEIYLPSTVESLGKDAVSPALSTKIVVKNPALDFSNGMLLFGCNNAQNGIPAWFETKEAYAQAYLRALQADVPLTYLPHDVARTLATAVALKEGYGDEDFASYVLEPYEADGIDTPDELIETILGIYNSILGTNYTSADEIMFPAPACTCETCTHGTCLDCKRAGCDCCDCKDFSNYALEFNNNYTLYAFTDEFYTAFDAAVEAAHTEDLLEYFNGTSIYYLGDAPQATDENNHVLDLTPAPWLTVYGFAGSTAEAAAQTSGVNFVALDADDTVWNIVDGKLRAFGTCGDNCTWSIENGVLSINGDGAVHAIKRVNCKGELELYFPWNDVVIKAFEEQYGVFEEDALIGAIMTGRIDPIEYVKGFAGPVYERLEIGEGITSFDENAFDRNYPSQGHVLTSAKTIVLPSTLASMPDSMLDAAFANTLIVRNPNFDFASAHIWYYGSTGAGSMFATAEESYERALTVTGLVYGYSIPAEWADLIRELNKNSNTMERLDNVNRIFGWNAASFDEAIALALAELNARLGTDFTSAEQVVVDVEGVQGYDYTPEFKAAVQPLKDAYDAEVSTVDHMKNFDLGSSPQWTDNNETVDLTPVPWLTVLGVSGSTAETAAQTSGVNFQPLCPVNVDHTVAQKGEMAPTCIETGVSAGWYCEDCGRYLSGGETIAATGHRHTHTVAATEPTRRAHGYTEGVFCDDCQTYLSGHEVIHNQLGASEIVKEPTETEEGEAEIYCTVCGGKGLYAIEKLEPEPEQPAQQDNGNSKDDDNFFRKLAKGVINFFLRLIKWIGGGK